MSEPIRELAEEIAMLPQYARLGAIADPHRPRLSGGEHSSLTAHWEARLLDLLDQERSQWLKDGPERERILVRSLSAQMRETERLEAELEKLEVPPELSQALGDLAVMREALESYVRGDEALYGSGAAGGPRYDQGSSALFSDAGRLAGELIRAAVKVRTLRSRWLDKEEPPLNDDKFEEAFVPAIAQFDSSADALLAAFPALRQSVSIEEVERGI